MIPGQPGELRAVGAQPRGGVKIVARDQDLRLAVGDVDADQRIHSFSTGLGMIFSHTN
jgi:hypothetical protein